MSAQTETAERTTGPAKDIAAALRAILRRRMARTAAGARLRANPFRRLAAAVARGPRVKRSRPDQPGRLSLTIDMPFGPFSLSALGLGLAGGGGGSPGWQAMVTTSSTAAQRNAIW
ncbi:MAG: hypothetical protein Q4G24_08920 [Paracoccus sp. (in: a-proteobacteria)]|uniref:hypothetical protein n=1 Tax=Paracoccus sp. TaxID=267 RepID=UPI0026DFE6A3|nr:hypothetical protein [Paracoccus sp. (in: a-proteobacteria)]MDO5621576.1 hypothetical protein [Paracoccus sp. (in: a-proteobacteria)]